MTEYELAMAYYVCQYSYKTEQDFHDQVEEYGMDFVKFYYFEWHNEEYGTDWEL